MRALITFAAVLAVGSGASAQTTVTSTYLSSAVQLCRDRTGNTSTLPTGFCDCNDASCTRRAQHLTNLVLANKADDLVRSAWAIVTTIGPLEEQPQKKLGNVIGDIKENYYRIVWKGVDADDKPTVYHVLLHNGKRPDPDNLLPGIRGSSAPQLYDVLVTDIVEEAGADGTVKRESPLDTLSSVYVSTRVANPLLAQIPDFIAKTNVLEFWAKATGPGGGRALRPGEPFTEGVRHRTRYTIYRAELPHGRATIQVTDQIVALVPDVDAVIAKAEDLLTRLAKPQYGVGSCALSVARAHVASLRDASSACSAVNPTSLSEARDAARDCADMLNRALRKTSAAITKSDECVGRGAASNDEVALVDSRFKGIVETVTANSVNATSRLVNEPRTWVSFGVMAAVMLGQPHIGDGYVRAKLDGGVFVADPMPHLLSAAVVNIHPRPYQAALPHQSWKERLRTFGGVTITPDFGLAAGVGCSVVRGLVVNVGGTIMWTNTVKADSLGTAYPEAVDKNGPFTLKPATAGLFGLSYTFK